METLESAKAESRSVSMNGGVHHMNIAQAMVFADELRKIPGICKLELTPSARYLFAFERQSADVSYNYPSDMKETIAPLIDAAREKISSVAPSLSLLEILNSAFPAGSYIEEMPQRP